MLFSQLSRYFQKLEQTSSRNTMTEILSDLFTRADKREIGKICYLLQGRVVPLYEAVEFGVADKFMIRAIARAYGVSGDHVKWVFKTEGDLGAVAEKLRTPASPAGRQNSELPTSPKLPPSPRLRWTGRGASKTTAQNVKVTGVYEKLVEIANMSGKGSQEKKIEALSQLLFSVDSLSARYLVRIPLDKLRLGFSDMTILDALSWMLAGDKSLRVRLEGVYNIRPDIGLLAEQVKVHGVAGLSHVKVAVGAPILASLCQRLPTADEMIKKMGTVAVEGKYDGVRVQIHYKKLSAISHQLSAYSRNLENTTEMFPELQDVGKQLNAHEVILDSEAVGMDPKTGKLIAFQETMTRKRKHDIAKQQRAVPLKFFVFDILLKDGKELLNLPLSSRRSILEQTVKKGDVLSVSAQIVTNNAHDIRIYHDQQLTKGLEGAVVKKWASPYEPGRRGYSWVKLKEEEGKTGKLTDTIDAVVMGYYRGEGKRAGFGIGAFLVGVRRSESYVTITKIGTGVSDALWKELRVAFNTLKVSQMPNVYSKVGTHFVPDVWVAPKLVVEIAGDDLTRSPTHGAGVAVRFPRLVRIRTDKSASQATTVAEIMRMFRQQKRS